jgi:hypothetical protein
MMSIRFSKVVLAASALALSSPLAAQTASATPEASAEALSEDWRENYAYAVGLQAVIYGFPAVKNLNMRYSMVEKPVGVTDTPQNQWFHIRRPADPTDTTHGSVSEDFLYSVGWFDVRKEPVVVSVPGSGERYFGTQFMEWYSDIFAYLGTRATGGKAGSYLLVGPGWQGELPSGIAGVIRAPTPTGAIIQRVGFLDERSNLNAVHQLQDASDLRPLSSWLAGDNSVSNDRDVIDPAAAGSPLAFFINLNRAMTQNPPPAKDRAIISMLRSVGLGPGQSDDLSRLDAGTRKGLERALKDGMRLISQVSIAGGETKIVNHWAYNQKSWGRTAETDDFLTRSATQSFSGFLEHQIEEVVKLRAHFDGEGQQLDGSKGRYFLRFAADQIPQAKAFWSVTVYNDQYDLFANPLKRYSFGSLDKGLKYDADGGLTFHLQADPPAQQHLVNWLPVPKAPFNLFLRAYLPHEDLINQTYVPPAVELLN